VDEHINDGKKRIFLYPDGNWVNALNVEIIIVSDPLSVTLQMVSAFQHTATFTTTAAAQTFLELWLDRIEKA